MSTEEKNRFIVRAAMTEYMTLMAGTVLIYLAVQLWPRATYVIAILGGLALAIACVFNFLLILRTTPTSHTHHRPRQR